jgi:trk system potassium uptake protein TrkH
MRGRFTAYVLGAGLSGLALLMLLFCFYAALLREPILPFAVTAIVSGAVGGLLLRLGVREYEPTTREALLGVLLLWFFVPLFGALPFALSSYFDPLNALFESMSGFTTTGATVLRDFATFPLSLFMWRSVSQWIGGVGIIVLFIAVFPQLAIAGRQLFFAEVPGPTEDRLTPRLQNTVNAVLLVYIGLTVLCAIAYILVGMSVYDGISHAFTTLASGGFSPNGASFEGYPRPAMQWVAIVFMVFAGANFALQYQLVIGRSTSLLRDTEFRAYIGIIVIATVLLVLALADLHTGEARIRQALFQALTMITTTGYASADFALWPAQAQVILLLLMFIGGRAGSAAGGVKVVRWLIILKSTTREVHRSLHPRAILPVRVGRQIIPDEVLRAVAAFITLYILLFAFLTAVLAWLGEDFTTALTASIAAVGNIGPGLADVGPMLNFADIHPAGRALLIFGMYAGRLEIVTVLVLLDPDLWRLPRRRETTREHARGV